MALSVPDKILSAVINIVVILWDNVLALLNLFVPKRQPGQVVPKGSVGHNLTWPEFVPPKPGDSRSACPMLNALSNHGILPHDGKNITFRQLNRAIRETYNFAPSFCFFAPKFAADFLERSYWTDRLNLADLNLHADNAIEHDGSLTRQDLALQPDQSYPDQKLVDEFLNEASAKAPDGSPIMTKADMSRALSKRRAEARKTNPGYSETLFHNIFGSANSCTMLTIFGGRIDDLTPMLKEERFPDHWEPRVTEEYGLTMAKFNSTVLPVEFNVNPKKYA